MTEIDTMFTPKGWGKRKISTNVVHTWSCILNRLSDPKMGHIHCQDTTDARTPKIVTLNDRQRRLLYAVTEYKSHCIMYKSHCPSSVDARKVSQSKSAPILRSLEEGYIVLWSTFHRAVKREEPPKSILPQAQEECGSKNVFTWKRKWSPTQPSRSREMARCSTVSAFVTCCRR